ncbi:HAD-IIB family hydrolase [Roseibium denhamense]|uniref:Sucrose phosphatase-like domain-containing protein n=1 Tax=Roseibium denhamense TaxID=76305 RepID=A0ABY1PN62_9HYPH|nr:HAD-IIB family hydrolase [Roseibium denhamense]MTI05731.1 HAD-IIB family hydrolase [Roseibium denhamense]SMP36956.1 hypothetical protein SAMN06265374_4400 [Roseibium denhamense]
MGEQPVTDVWLLVSDIDDTLTGDQAALEQLCAALAARSQTLKVALNSSRPAASVDQTLSEYFPAGFKPDAVITGLGTEVRIAGRSLETWTRQFEDWPDENIRDYVRRLGFQPHDDIYQTGGKASFTVQGRTAAEKVMSGLKGEGFEFKSIFSGTSDLDILAPGAGKDAAMRHLAEHLGIPLARTIAAGDSGNDLALFQAARRAIAVGNAREELVNKMPVHKTYHATAPHAGGVAEGLIAYGLLPKAP